MKFVYLFYFLSFILGSLLTLAIVFKEVSGVISIKDVNGKENWVFIMEKPFDKIRNSKLVVLRVKNNSRS